MSCGYTEKAYLLLLACNGHVGSFYENIISTCSIGASNVIKQSSELKVVELIVNAK